MYASINLQLRVADTNETDNVHTFILNREHVTDLEMVSSLNSLVDSINTALSTHGAVSLWGHAFQKAEVLDVSYKVTTTSQSKFFSAIGATYAGAIQVPAQGRKPVEISF